MHGKLLNARQVADLFGIPRSTAWKLARSGGPFGAAAVRINQRVRFRLDVLDAFISAGGTANDAAPSSDPGAGAKGDRDPRGAAGAKEPVGIRET